MDAPDLPPHAARVRTRDERSRCGRMADRMLENENCGSAPLAAEGLDQGNGNGEAFGADGVEAAFGIEAGALGIDDVEEADESCLEAFGREVEGFAGSVDGVLLGLFPACEDGCALEGVFHFAEGDVDGLSVVGAGVLLWFRSDAQKTYADVCCVSWNVVL